MNFDLQRRLTAFAMLGATWVMWLLVILSIVGLAVARERAFYFFSTRDDGDKLRDDVVPLFRRGDFSAAKTRLAQSKSIEAKVVLSALELRDAGREAVQAQLLAGTQLARLQMERTLAFLGTVGNNAPFLGLLGTVIGVMRSFSELGDSGGRVSAGLMGEIGEALVATAIGILVALPSVAAFNFFQRTIKGRVVRAEALGNALLAYFDREGSAARDEKPSEAAAGEPVRA